ncbi:hypothetical protein [Brevundimonas sp.]|jgi:hypothetical protein|uniref:hypothetical protein n=1 Tax=Brevundimonas sp. TaxID=1871086 RepID=UPI0037BFB851
MNLMLSAAQGMMRLARRIAPASRDDWKAAMQGEFSMVGDARQALSWSAGCLATALGWRIAHEAPPVAGIILASIGAYLAYLALFWTTDYSTSDLPFLMVRQQQACIAAAGLICGLIWPDRALLTAVAIPSGFSGGGFLQFAWVDVLTPREGHSGYREWGVWSSLVPAFVLEIWPGVAGALAGFVIAKILRGATMERAAKSRG